MHFDLRSCLTKCSRSSSFVNRSQLKSLVQPHLNGEKTQKIINLYLLPEH
jgi:hypothetical protein